MKAKRVFDCALHAVDLQKAFGYHQRPANYQSMEHAVKAIKIKMHGKGL